MNANDRITATSDPKSEFYLEDCGCCGCYHRPGFSGDCRNDSQRFAYPEQLYDLSQGIDVEPDPFKKGWHKGKNGLWYGSKDQKAAR